MKSSSPEESNPPGQSFGSIDHPLGLPSLGPLFLPMIEIAGFLPIPDDLCSGIYQWLLWRSKRAWLVQILLMIQSNFHSSQRLHSILGNTCPWDKELVMKPHYLICLYSFWKDIELTWGRIVLECTNCGILRHYVSGWERKLLMYSCVLRTYPTMGTQ